MAFALPAILLYSSLRTFRELDAQREVYLRQRAATIASELEAASARNEPLEATIQSLGDNEPHLLDLRITAQPGDSAGDPAVEAVWSGRALFHTQFADSGGTRIYRAYVPLHASGRLNVAQIDLDASAANFLLEHARHNIYISIAGGLVLILLSFYTIWAAGRTAALERRQLELEHLAHLGTMSAVLAHEIRNPLGAIKGFVQLALEKSETAVEPLLTPVLEQTSRLEALVSDLLVYGRPPSPNIRPVPWRAIADGLEAHAGRIAGGRPVELFVEKPDLQLHTDPDLLEHILVNLLRNAVDAVVQTPGGRVEVSAKSLGGAVEFSVRDNGPGIPASDLEKVRQPFYTTKSFGTGLGLPISARLTEALRGAFDLRAADPRGTIATIRLPNKS